MMSSEAALFVSVPDICEAGERRLPLAVNGYYYSGADAQRTVRANTSSYAEWGLRPRVLRDVSKVSLSTTLLGSSVKSPIGVAPTAMQRMAHPEGECASSRACDTSGSCFVLSTLSTSSLEEVQENAPGALRWFQLYIYKNREATQALVERAQKAGYKALVLTVDTPVLGKREADHRNNFSLPPHLRLANFDTDTSESDRMNTAHLQTYFGDLVDPSLTWSALEWLKSITSLPIVVKGILTADDAIIACDRGASAIIVSNHGGRQLDDVPATIDALPEVVAAVGHRCEVYLDGGIRRGSDVFKALALGARSVFIGRPVLYGLAIQGQKGVEHVLETLNEELSRTMALTGCTSTKEINASYIFDKKAARSKL